MFDSTPQNLPVEPIPVSPNAPPLVSASTPASPVLKERKEPEDIFSSLDQSSGAMRAPAEEFEDVSTHRPMWVWILAGIVGLLVLGGVAFAVWMFVLKPSRVAPVIVNTTSTISTTTGQEQVEQPPVIEQQPITQPPAGVVIPPPQVFQTPTPDPSVASSSEVASTSVVANTSSQMVAEGRDTDGDGLTDIEEGLYTSDPLKKDTDGDGYADGSEIVNLFSPITKNGLLSAESSMMKGSWKGISFVMPKSWVVTQDALQQTKASIDLGSGSRIQLEIQSNPTKRDVTEWASAGGFAPFHTERLKNGTLIVDLGDVTMTGGADQDSLTSIVPMGDEMLVVKYTIGSDLIFNYRSSYRMFLNSLARGSSQK